MSFLVCSCGLALRIVGAEDDELSFLLGEKSDWYPDRYPCPRHTCGKKMTYAGALASSDMPSLNVVDTSLREAYAALQGLGLPPERDCGVTAVKNLMEGNTLKSVDCVQLKGANRTAIHSLTFECGTTLFLASSPEGALAYRMASPRSYVKEVLDG